MNPIPAILKSYDDFEEYVRSLIEVPRRQDEQLFDEEPPLQTGAPTFDLDFNQDVGASLPTTPTHGLDLGEYNDAGPKPWILTTPTRGGVVGEGTYLMPSGRTLEYKVATFVLACIAGIVVYL